MRKLTIAALAATALLASGAQNAQAATAPAGPSGPCATQQALFDKYGIGLNMDAPFVGYASGTVCGITG